MMSTVRGRKEGTERRFIVRCDRCGRDDSAQFVTPLAALRHSWRKGWGRLAVAIGDDPADVCPDCLTADEGSDE